MIVYGCTADKNVVACDFSAQEILRYGIEPEYLDLFETDPVIVERDGQTLQFSPMRQFAFYLLPNPYLGSNVQLPAKHLAMLDGSGRSCFMAGSPRQSDAITMFPNLERGSMSFEDAFAAFVQWKEWRAGQPFGKFNYDLPAPEFQGTRLRSDSIRIVGKNGTAEYEIQTDLLQGRMFKKFKVEANTTQRIDWVLEALAPWKPVVTGNALVNARLKRPIKNVAFRVGEGSLSPVFEHLKKLGFKLSVDESLLGQIHRFSFKHDGCRYTGTGDDPDALMIPFSVEQMECAKSNEIEATWLALHDCDKKRLRHYRGLGSELEEQAKPTEFGADRLTGFSFVKVEPLARAA